MVEVEVRQEDVADIGRLVTHRLDLADRGLLLAQLDVEHRHHRGSDARPGSADVLEAIAGIDQDEAAARFDDEAVANELALKALAAPVEERAAERAIGAAVDVMDVHENGNGAWRAPFPPIEFTSAVAA